MHPFVLGPLMVKKIKIKMKTPRVLFPKRTPECSCVKKKKKTNWVEGLELDEPQEMRKGKKLVLLLDLLGLICLR